MSSGLLSMAVSTLSRSAAALTRAQVRRCSLSAPGSLTDFFRAQKCYKKITRPNRQCVDPPQPRPRLPPSLARASSSPSPPVLAHSSPHSPPTHFLPPHHSLCSPAAFEHDHRWPKPSLLLLRRQTPRLNLKRAISSDSDGQPQPLHVYLSSFSTPTRPLHSLVHLNIVTKRASSLGFPFLSSCPVFQPSSTRY